MTISIVEFLLGTSRRFREQIDLEKITQQLTSDNIGDRGASALFAVYHLLISGPIAEENVQSYIRGARLPTLVLSMIDDTDQVATEEAWRGTAFEKIGRA